MMVSGELQFDDKGGERAEEGTESDVSRKKSHGCCGRTDGNEERGQEGLTLPRCLSAVVGMCPLRLVRLIAKPLY